MNSLKIYLCLNIQIRNIFLNIAFDYLKLNDLVNIYLQIKQLKILAYIHLKNS